MLPMPCLPAITPTARDSSKGWGAIFSLAGPLTELLAGIAAVVETDVDLGTDEFSADEGRYIDNVIEARRREFETTRVCARMALAKIGVAPTVIPMGPSGEPIWPDGVVGSLTHTAGYRAAAVSESDKIMALGIDVEQHVPLPPSVWGYVLDEEERRWAGAVGQSISHIFWDSVIFSAKEATFKALFPMSADFHIDDIHIELGESFGTFVAYSTTRRGGLNGGWQVKGKHVFTALGLASERD